MKIKFGLGDYEYPDLESGNSTVETLKKNLEGLTGKNDFELKEDSMGVKYLNEKNKNFRVFVNYSKNSLLLDLNDPFPFSENPLVKLLFLPARVYSGKDSLKVDFCSSKSNYLWDIASTEPFFSKKYKFKEKDRKEILDEASRLILETQENSNNLSK